MIATGSTSPRSRGRQLAAVSLAAIAVASLAGCGRQSDAAGNPAGTTTVATDPSTTNATTGTITSAYGSAITDQVVDNPQFDAFGREIADRITKAGLPGASLLVLQGDKLVEQEAFGGYDLSTQVPIASASKWLSGATIMTLVDEGRIDLDAPIKTYLPDAKGPSGEITMRQLLSFTSGLEYDEKIPCYMDFSKTLAECNTEILGLKLLGAPGTGYRYTGTHLHVAAGVAEAVTGQTWEQLFQERIAEPLGMTRTTFVPPTHTGAADGHPQPAGSGMSTLGDYGRFLEMLVHDGVAPNGTRVLSEHAIAELSKKQTGDAKFVSAAAYRKQAETPYGLAHWLDVINPDGTALVESSPGKFGFRPWIDHENNIAGVYLIVDHNDENVADSPDRAASAKAGVQTSGNWILVETAKALGGVVPEAAVQPSRGSGNGFSGLGG